MPGVWDFVDPELARLAGRSGSRVAARRPQQQQQGMSPEEEASLLSRVGNKTVGGISAVGNVLDLPGSIVRDLATWVPGGIKARNPLDQFLSPTSPRNRTTGRELLRSAGMVNRRDNWGNLAGGIGLEALMDPLTYMTFGAGAAARGAGTVSKAAGLFDDSVRVANKLKGLPTGTIGKRQSRATTTLRQLIDEGGPGAMQRAQNAASKQGHKLDDILDDTVGGMVGFGMPFQAPTKVVGGTGRAGKVADAIGDTLSRGPVAWGRQLLDKNVREHYLKPFQHAGEATTRAIERARPANKKAMFDNIHELQETSARIGLDPNDIDQQRLWLEGIDDNIPAELAPLIGRMRAQDAANQSAKLTAGARAPELTGEYIADHASRYATTPQRSTAGRGKSMNFDDPANLRRKEYFKNWEGGTKTVREVIQDPEWINARADGWTAPEIGQRIVEKYGDLIFEVRDDIANGVLPRNPNWRTHSARFAPTWFARTTKAADVEKILFGTGAKKTTLFSKASPTQEFAVELDSAFKGKLIQFNGWQDAYRNNQIAGFDAITPANVTQRAIKSIQMPAGRKLTQAAEKEVERLVEKAGWTDTVADGIRTISRHPNAPSMLPKLERTARQRATDFGRFIKNAPEEAIDQGLFSNQPAIDLWRASDSASVVKHTADTASDLIATLLKNPQRMPRRGEPVSLTKTLQDANLAVGTEQSPGRAVELLANKAKLSTDEIFNMQVPKPVADEILRPLNLFKGPLPVGRGVEAYDSALNLFKGFVTGLFPAFHSRNLTSGQFRNWIEGALGRDGARIGRHLLTGSQPPADVLQKVLDIPVIQQRLRQRGLNTAGPAAQTAAWRELRQLASENNVTSRYMGMQNDILGQGDSIRNTGTVEGIMEELPGSSPYGVGNVAGALAGRSGGATWNPRNWRMRGVAGAEQSTFPLAAAGEQAGYGVESMNRLPPFVQQLLKGVDPTQAAQRVRAGQVDYHAAANTRFFNDVVARMFPFAKFTRGNAEYVARELLNRPGGKMGQTIRVLNKLRDPNAMTPDYVAETSSIPLTGALGNKEEGTDRYLTGLGLMLEDPMAFVSGDRTVKNAALELASRSSPFIKAPLEWMTGQSFFQKGPQGGRAIEDLDPTIGRTLANIKQLATGEETRRAQPVLGSRGLEFVLGNSPLARLLTTARQLTDPRKGAGAKAMNLLTGPRISDISPAAQEAILREKLTDFGKQYGLRTFTRPYLPAEEIDKLPPRQSVEAKLIQAMLNELDRRAKRRSR